ncbi:MAG TPA: ABC transporter permease [Candidatus Saccharimonadales bacterium]|jgi:putative ABC transport system permease protein|nr:ABC transporter permease [Candidatus Saccharimonadales bacterium]
MKTLTRGHLKAGLDSVRGAKVRSFWTMLGVVIGVASVITVVSIGEGIKGQVSGQIHHYGKNLITVRPAQLQPSGSSGQNLGVITGLNLSSPLTDKDVMAVRDAKGVQASAPLTITPGSIKGETGSYGDGFVIGTTQDLPSLLNQSLSYGDFWNESDSDSNVAVVGQHAAQKMFNVDVPLGHSFTFHGQQFVVRGIFNQFVTTPLSQQVDFNNAIFIPNDVAENLTNSTAPTYAILARGATDQQVAMVAKNVTSAMVQAHGSNNGFEVLSGNQNLAVNDTILNLLTRLIAGIAAISLLVGGLGIMNVMLVSVSERLHEIGIRKAVGATNRQIMSQFMVEATALSLAGGLIGILISFLIDLALRAWTTLQPNISWQIVVIASGVSLLVGVIFGTIPAAKAARKDPILALRSE